jgi:hypothetical protein
LPVDELSDSVHQVKVNSGKPWLNRGKSEGDGAFVANDWVLAEDRIWLATGLNMAGNGTFLRQNALIAILAPMGSYVPRHRRGNLRQCINFKTDALPIYSGSSLRIVALAPPAPGPGRWQAGLRMAAQPRRPD